QGKLRSNLQIILDLRCLFLEKLGRLTCSPVHSSIMLHEDLSLLTSLALRDSDTLGRLIVLLSRLTGLCFPNQPLAFLSPGTELTGLTARGKAVSRCP